MSWLRGRDAELVCGSCGAVFASVRVRPPFGRLDVHSIVTGAVVMPRPGYSVNEESRQRVARAESTGPAETGWPDPDEARTVANYLRRASGEIIYDLTCRCRLRYLRSAPDLHRQITHTGGRWVTLAPATATWSPPPSA